MSERISETEGGAGVLALKDPFGWLRGWSFDLVFIVGISGAALLSGWLSVIDPKMFPTILFLDLWILGYHHVVATFTRLSFDLESFKEHKFLIVWLPWIIVTATALAALILGPWILATTYLYWQWFHYTRQSFGIARIYSRKGSNVVRNPRLEQLTLYLLPLTGILYRSYQNPGTFLGMELKVLPVPFWVVNLFLAASVGVVIWWVGQQILDYREGHFQWGYTLYMCSHIAVFTVGYLMIRNINYGWLCLNVWHNAQYVMLVWMFNNNRFKNGVDPSRRFLSTLSQTKNMWIYYGVCLSVSTVIYLSVDKVLGFITFTALPLTMIVYQTINFHHYVVDGIIWKLRKKPVSSTLGLNKG